MVIIIVMLPPSTNIARKIFGGYTDVPEIIDHGKKNVYKLISVENFDNIVFVVDYCTRLNVV